MAKGQLYAAERRELVDEQTGIVIRQVTAAPAIHHHPFYYLPSYDDAMMRLIFVSQRTGRPEVFAEIRSSRQLVQLTERADLYDWSVHPSHDGRYVYFAAQSGAWRIDAETLKEEELVSFRDVSDFEEDVGSASVGTTSLSLDDRWWAVPLRIGQMSRFVIIDTRSGRYEVILERDNIGHPEFHPNDSTLLRYAASYTDRMWVINRDGSGNRMVYRRDAQSKEWIVHETWRPGTRELVATRWPHGMIGVDIDTGSVRTVCRFNAWHASINRQGTLMCADTTFPDIGLQIFDPRPGLGEAKTLCLSKSSNIGAHWNTDHCPYDDGPTKVYAPQHTHPHPSFSPDGRYVVFTSDRTGYAQVYEAELPDQFLGKE